MAQANATTTMVIGPIQRGRSLSLSLTLSLAPAHNGRKPVLLSLPAEVVLHIVELTATANSPILKHEADKNPSSNTCHGFQAIDADGDWTMDWNSDGDRGRNDLHRGNVHSERQRDDHKMDVRSLLALARTCRALASLAHGVLYRVVRLSDPLQTERFARSVWSIGAVTAHNTTNPMLPLLGRSVGQLMLDCISTVPIPPGMGRAAYVRRHNEYQAQAAAARILAPASVVSLSKGGTSVVAAPPPLLDALRTLVVHTKTLRSALEAISSSSPPNPMSVPAPTEIILDTFLPPPSVDKHDIPIPSLPKLVDSHFVLHALARATTHLRIALPAPYAMQGPAATLAALGGLPALTHLALVRRTNANVDNDREFVEVVRNVLATRPELRCLVVSIFAEGGWADAQAARDLARNPIIHMHAIAAGIPAGTDNPAVAAAQPAGAPSAEARSLEAYLVSSDIWAMVAKIAWTDTRLRLVPGFPDAWESVHPASASRSQGTGRKSDYGKGPQRATALGTDFWSWAREYDEERREQLR